MLQRSAALSKLPTDDLQAIRATALSLKSIRHRASNNLKHNGTVSLCLSHHRYVSLQIQILDASLITAQDFTQRIRRCAFYIRAR